MKEEVLADLEQTCLAGSKAMREFLTYRGTNPDYYKRARIGASGVGGYSRVRATISNEETNRLSIMKMERKG